jgi:hypothetical protein
MKAQSCPGLGTITLTVAAAPAPTLNFAPQLCAGASTNIVVNQSFTTYSWSNTANTQSISVNAPGNYTVTVSNAAGCTNTAQATIAAAPTPAPSITQNPYACNGTATLNAGSGFTTYAWSNGGGTNATANFNTNGTYSVTVTNSVGCSGTANFTVTIPAPPSVTIGGNLTFCANATTTLNATAGFTTYSWTGGGSGANLSVSTPGTYTVTVTDAFTCTTTASATTTALPIPTPTVTNANLCPGTSTTLSVSNPPFSTYTWSTGDNSVSTSVNAPGNYTVTVTGSNACTNTAVSTVTGLPAPAPNITQQTYACNGQYVLDAGAGFTSYQWSNGPTNATSSVNSNGTYTVTVTNAQGCTATDDQIVSIPTPPVVNISGPASICASAVANLVATSGFSSYAWSNGQNGVSININTAGNFTVTATDAFGCTDTDNFTLSVLPNPSPDITGSTSICSGSSTTFSLTAPFNAYNWSTGENSASISVSTAGLYTVTVTATNGCTGTTTENLSLIPLPAPNITEAPYNCNNQIVLNAGAGFTGYNWSNSVNTASNTVTTSGSFTVTVTNAAGCTGTDTYLATIPTPPTVTITGNSSFCTGSNTQLSANSGYSGYVWSNGQFTQNVNVNLAGSYQVTVTDVFGCTATDNFTLNALPAPNPTINGLPSICNGLSTVYSVSAPFSNYAWSTGQNSATISVNAAGLYTVTVTAANGCTGTDTQNLNLIPAPNPGISELPYLCDEQITIQANAGFVTYNWSNSANTASITVTNAQSYSVTVTNAQGCSGTNSYFVNIPTLPVVSITGPAQICAGTTATLAATPGFSGYVWSNNGTAPSITVGQSGNYTVTVTDFLGCTATNTFSINTVNNPVAVIAGPATICNGSSATFSVAGSFSAYQWSTGANTANIVVNTANNYTVTITDTNGCTGTDTQNLIVSTSLSPQIVEQPYACNGLVTLDAGLGFATYNWTGGTTNQTLVVNANGNYTVTVSDGGGCTGTAVVTANLPTAPVVNISGVSTICQGANTVLNATTGFSTYVWSNGQVGENITVGLAGPFTVTATDVFGCTTTAGFTLNTTAAPAPQISAPAVICVNSSATLAAGSGFSSYLWNNAETTANIVVNTGGIYSVTVTNIAGCSGTASASLTVANSLSPNILSQPYQCNGQITLDAGLGFSTYQWSNSSNTQSTVVNTSGNYIVTVTDASGCIGVDTFAATVPALSAVAITGSPVFCANSSTVLTANGAQTYQWSNGGSQNNITVNTTGAFTVTATDANGCTLVASTSVSSQPLPTPVITGPTSICAGINANFNVNQTFTSYIWNTGSTSAGISTSVSGPYTVTVTDNNGCIGTAVTALTINTNPTPQTSVQPYTCTGTLSLVADAGFTTYKWSNGSNTNIETVATSGTYTVTVTDGNGCTGIATQTVTVPTLSTVSIGGTTAFCPGGSTTLSASLGFGTYFWNTGAQTDAISVNTAGIFTVTVTDAIGCTATNTLTTNIFPAPVAAISGPSSVCPGNTATLGVNGTFSGFIWSNGATTANITVQPPLSATVTVTDGNGCTTSASTSVIVSNQITPNISPLPYACNGQISLDAGAGFPNYSWSTGGNTATIKVNTSGNYTVTVSDGNGCSGTASLQVQVPALPSVQISGDALLCVAETTTLSANAGFVTYNWSNGNNGPNINVNAGGNFTVTVSDALGCTATATQIVQSLPAVTPQISGPNVICGNNPVQLSVTGNFSAFNWSGGQNTTSVSVNQAGTYSVTVTDANGCTGNSSITVNAGAALSLVVSQLPYQCDGQISLSVDPGYANYNWNNGFNTADIKVNQNGNYTVTVSDAAGCTGTVTALVSIPTNPQVSIVGTPTLCAGQTTNLSASGIFNSYSWSNGGTTPQVTVSAPGLYSLVVKDALGCTAANTIVVTQKPPFTPAISVAPVDCASQMFLLADQGYTVYAWNTGEASSVITVNQAGTFSVTVTDASGCTGLASAIVKIAVSDTVLVQKTACDPASIGVNIQIFNKTNGCDSLIITETKLGAGITGNALAISNFNGYNIACKNGLNGEASVTPLSGTAPFSYQWSNGSSNSIAQNLAAGDYSVTFTDAAGCSGTASVQLDEPVAVQASIDATNPTCQNAGIIVVTQVAGGFGPYTVRLVQDIGVTNGIDPLNFNSLDAGNFNVEISDANGCKTTENVVLLPAQAVKEFVSDTFDINLGDTLQINAGAGITIAPLNINWSLSGPGQLSCDNCLDPVLVPVSTTLLQLDVQGFGQCAAQGLFLIRVNKKKQVYIPNVIDLSSLNNNAFTVFGDERLVKIKSLQIYDRWGTQMVLLKEFLPNDPNQGWDGLFRGQAVLPGVYVYWTEVLYRDGTSEIIEGDVTVLR